MRNNYIVFISSIVYALLVLIGCGDDNPVNDSREEESHDAGATSYSVYISGDPLGGFRKVKTVQERTAIIPGLVRNRKYYVYTVANMRKGKQVYTSPKTNRYSFRLQAD